MFVPKFLQPARAAPTLGAPISETLSAAPTLTFGSQVAVSVAPSVGPSIATGLTPVILPPAASLPQSQVPVAKPTTTVEPPPAAHQPPTAAPTSDSSVSVAAAPAVPETESKPSTGLSVVTNEEAVSDKSKTGYTPNSAAGVLQRGKSVDTKPVRGASSTPVASATPTAGDGGGWKRGASMPGGTSSAAAAAKDGSSLRYDKATLLSLFSRTPKIPAELSKLYPAHLQKERLPILMERQQQHGGGRGGGGGGNRYDRNNQQSTVSDAPHPDEAIIFSAEHLSDESHFKYVFDYAIAHIFYSIIIFINN